MRQMARRRDFPCASRWVSSFQCSVSDGSSSMTANSSAARGLRGSGPATGEHNTPKHTIQHASLGSSQVKKQGVASGERAHALEQNVLGELCARRIGFCVFRKPSSLRHPSLRCELHEHTHTHIHVRVADKQPPR